MKLHFDSDWLRSKIETEAEYDGEVGAGFELHGLKFKTATQADYFQAIFRGRPLCDCGDGRLYQVGNNIVVVPHDFDATAKR